MLANAPSPLPAPAGPAPSSTGPRALVPVPPPVAPAAPGDAGSVDLDRPELYLNRELSWLEFDSRVLEEALDSRNPLLERVKFLSIFAANLDEFFMIRVSGLRRQLTAGVVQPPADGMSPAEQLAALRERLMPTLQAAARSWSDDLLPKLRDAGINIVTYKDLKNRQRKLLRRYFKDEIFPALTPLAFDPGHPFPHISNLSINLAVVVAVDGQGERFARLKVPQGVFPRLLRIPTEDRAESVERLGLMTDSASSHFVWLEEVIAANLDLLFPGLEIRAVHPFRVTRDADFEIEEDEASDLLETMEEVLGQRHFGFAVRLEVDDQMPEAMRSMLVQNLGLAPYQTFSVDRPLGMADVAELSRIDRPELKDPPFLPSVPPFFASSGSLFATLRQRNVLLYHPYDSFNSVADFIREAARDPDVLTIKQTLYRVGSDSPIVEALQDARENGKQVAVLVELKARFDETNNIVWARALERAGVHVVYGVLGLKTHAKMCLVVRREKDGIRCYVHLGTGNYNPQSSRVYGDLALFTADPVIAADVADLFNSLTGYSQKDRYEKLLVAPQGMRRGILERIEREIEVHRREGGGHLAFKLNALVDPASIRALYRASRAGVRIDLQVRGVCCLRPGLPGVSETIEVTSLVGRFLEHSRIFYFKNGGNEEILIGSADLMPRNLDGRVEILAPIDDPAMRRAIRDEILKVHLRDTRLARRLRADGSYERVEPAPGEPPFDSQRHMLERRGAWWG